MFTLGNLMLLFYVTKSYHSQPNCALAAQLRPITVKYAGIRPIAGGDLHGRIRYYSESKGCE